MYTYTNSTKMDQSASIGNDSDELNELLAMGFDRTDAKAALDVTDGNLERAVNFLLTGENVTFAQPSTSANIANTAKDLNSATQIQGTVNQYIINNGRSACTSIAIHGAIAFHTQLNKVQKSVQNSAFIDANFLDQIVRDGCETYTEWMKQQHSPSAEHTSVEEILQFHTFSKHNIVYNGIKQGLLSSPIHDPLGLHTLLSSCQSSSQWICVILTKPPETILLCLPPIALNAESHKYYLVDSHPRMNEFAVEQVYCQIHASLINLIRSISCIFPVTDLGPDIPDYVVSMYNSFDLYPLDLLQQESR